MVQYNTLYKEIVQEGRRVNRFQNQKNMGKNVRLLAAPVLLTVAVIGCVWNGITSVSDQTARQQKKSLEEAIRRDMVICYAMEGAYPESLEYLKEHYGLNYDETRYIINYEVMGSNLMPDVMVLEKQGS